MGKHYTHSKPEWAEKFYNSTVWKRKRVYIKMRDRYMCQCYKLFGGKPCGRIATEVHHIKDLVRYPELALEDDNLLSMSWGCHEKTKSKCKKNQTPQGVRIIKV